ncbi:dTDP-4-dehydrorhamnose reductase family protein [Flagellimonas lutimaris]|uniref:dTDP-4-dehydrorhamnose reductase family protein n=1 Tax=Flagellimonas lutimaris TaxID=475082 RepID=UPI003F5CCA4E
MKKKILIFGVSGMAGHVIYNYLSGKEKYEITATSFRDKYDEATMLLNVTNFDDVSRLVKKIEPDYIINAVGILISGSMDSTSNAILVNSYFPNYLVDITKNSKTKIIHISTDCVFSGKNGDYTESSFRDGDDVYARSKALGEVNNEKDLTIRTSIIGPEIKSKGEGLFHWFMNQSGKIKGFSNVYWSGVTTLELAKAIDVIISEKDLKGIFHLTNNKKVSKYELLCLFKQIWNRGDIEIEKYSGDKKDKSFKNTENTSLTVRNSYLEMLSEMKEFMEVNKSFYSY